MIRLLTLLLLSALPIDVVHAEDSTILVVGDSLSAAYGMATEQSWVSLLENRLRVRGYDYRVVNASIAGDTTQSGRYRLQRSLEQFSPAIVIIELGGNDGLRGLPLEVTRSNLVYMIETCQQSGATVVLAGIRIPPNYGPAYAENFHAIYPELAERYGLLLIPFILENVALDPDLMLADGIHPNVAGQEAMLDNIWPVLTPALEAIP
ncbi:MAG: arylesterase [Gammaproteobacteria bacterium]|nr:arylesterase [Gammaproteobacteria bacterium]